jgi:hypothetical protein
MKRLAIATLFLVAACSTTAATSSPGAGATTPAVLRPTSGAAMADLWCPAASLADCKAMVEAAVAGGLPAAVCTFIDGKWAVVTPKKGDAPGSSCGTDGTGTIRGIIVAP